MTRVLRTILTCLLLVAVPLQGYAASAMLFCGVAHGRTDTVVVDHATHGHAGHSHDADGHHDVDAASADGNDAYPTGYAHGGCSVCASCCSAAALPAATIAAAFAPPHASPSLPTEHAGPDRAPARLERPPRTALT